jgi:hypothetical protein
MEKNLRVKQLNKLIKNLTIGLEAGGRVANGHWYNPNILFRVRLRAEMLVRRQELISNGTWFKTGFKFISNINDKPITVIDTLLNMGVYLVSDDCGNEGTVLGETIQRLIKNQ